MSKPGKPTPARPFASFFYVDEAKLNRALDDLDGLLGERCFTSESRLFTKTDYYRREMGDGIMRIFAAWRNLVDPSHLIKMKIESWKIEDRLQEAGHSCPASRTVNIDPGLIEQGRLVLATGKPAPHRPYLGDGVYVDLTLIYERKSYRPLQWTYADYGEPECIEMLNTLRVEYLKDLK